MISDIPDSVQDSELKSTATSTSLILILMLNQGKWIAAELVNLIMALKRPLVNLSIGSIARKKCLTGSNWRELIEKKTSICKWNKNLY